MKNYAIYLLSTLGATVIFITVFFNTALDLDKIALDFFQSGKYSIILLAGLGVVLASLFCIGCDRYGSDENTSPTDHPKD